MVSAITPPRGMRDFLPAEKARRERVLGVIRAMYRAHGFDEIETPVMEDNALLHAGLGGDNEKLAFGVLRRGLTPEHLAAAQSALELSDLGLRFDLTVPLARFYASHRAELPGVFRSIQIAPVWRAERPQKGRYRQFVQCDIDVIGEAGPLAEVELLVATSDVLHALGLGECTIRINDRRLLTGMLEAFGFPSPEHADVLITLDKLDKLGSHGIVAELRQRGAHSAAVDALEEFLARPARSQTLPFGEAGIAAALPVGVAPVVVAQLAALGAAVEAARSGQGSSVRIEFDPFLVRGMGYYTGAIFEVVHPSLDYSLGGGGRYDGMIGRFLGKGDDVPAAGFSLGFERLVDLVRADEAEQTDAIALLHDGTMAPAELAGLKSELIARGARVRLVRRAKNLAPLLDSLVADGFSSFATVTAGQRADELALRPLGTERDD